MNDYKKIAKAILSDPAFFSKIDKGEINISNTKTDIPVRIVKTIFKLTDKEIETVQFVFWASYIAENILTQIISLAEKNQRVTKIVDDILDHVSFGDKIVIFTDLYGGTKASKYFVSIAWKINELRNHVAHGRFNKLEYKGLDLSTIKGQLKLLTEFIYSLSQLGKLN